jgi:hypothetical protein
MNSQDTNGEDLIGSFSLSAAEEMVNSPSHKLLSELGSVYPRQSSIAMSADEFQFLSATQETLLQNADIGQAYGTDEVDVVDSSTTSPTLALANFSDFDSEADVLTDYQAVVSDTLVSATQAAYSLLKQFALSGDFTRQMQDIFGEGLNLRKLDDFASGWKRNDFSTLPNISIQPTIQIRGGGAFSVDNNKIYLSEDLVLGSSSENSTNPVEAVVKVYLEEVGHFLDSQLNSLDTIGDEGGLFSARIRGESLTESDVGYFRSKDDHIRAVIEGQEITLERANVPVSINTLVNAKPADDSKKGQSDSDGKFEDENGNQSLRAVLEEAYPLSIPVDITFKVKGTIPNNGSYDVPSGSRIIGEYEEKQQQLPDGSVSIEKDSNLITLTGGGDLALHSNTVLKHILLLQKFAYMAQTILFKVIILEQMA